MIRESLYFSFDNIKSANYPIVNVNVGNGAFNESITSSKQIKESYPRNSFRPHFFGVQKNPKEFDMSFAFLEPWNDQMIDEIIRWLNVDDYKKLFFEADVDRVFYAQIISDINLIHNGLKQGYVTFRVRCDSAYSFSHQKTTRWYHVGDRIKDLREMMISNLGHYNTYPEIEIIKEGNGDISIFNITNANQEVKITGLLDGEEITIDCMNEEIETSLENTYRSDNHNDEYLELLYGDNYLKVTGDCYIRFKYEFIYS